MQEEGRDPESYVGAVEDDGEDQVPEAQVQPGGEAGERFCAADGNHENAGAAA